ncbi:VOC family protein [Maribacter sp. 2210JD10-5]|uniref:VOC family protein n=1 Tax=Maribacter sp. 2210JD10-5 TaxID=3386272 RepID=UPI0039BCB420
MGLFNHNLNFSKEEPSIKGFQEIIISVYNLEREVAFFQRICGWEIVSRSKGNSAIKQLWHLDDAVKIEEVLLHNPGDNTGFLRLVKFSNVEQRQIRSGTQIWDSGGIFDVNIRVKSIADMYRIFQNEGWNGYTDPNRFTFGKFDVSEVLMKGPDGVTFAMMQRFDPPLEGFAFEKVSRIFNSTTICMDYKKTRDFFINTLGFQLYFETEGTNRSNGPNVIGIPPNINSDVTVPVCILHPTGKNEGSLELLQTVELKGKDCAEFAKPPNLGILMYRFPVRDAEAYATTLKEKGLALNSDVQTVTVLPYGNLKVFSVRSPDGVWLEFIELLN